MTDLLIVGSGLTGATIARLASDHGIDVSVIERRNEIGGNLRDWRHPESGWLIHRHGPHFFRTNSQAIWQFVNRFAVWRKFEATVTTRVNHEYAPWPPSRNWLDRTYGTAGRLLNAPENFAQACLNLMPAPAVDDLVCGYVRKQWGVEADTLSADLAKRHEIREGDGDIRLKTHQWQALPNGGYSNFMARLLLDIPVKLGTDGRTKRGKKLTVFTGPIDEFFGFDLGRLRYRSQTREHLWFPGEAVHYPSTAVVYPNPKDGSHIRDTEWTTILPPSLVPPTGTLITRETPYTPTETDEYEYPFPSPEDRALYDTYASRTPRNVIFAGRLGRFAYFDMDQAIGHAFTLFRREIAPRFSNGSSPC